MTGLIIAYLVVAATVLVVGIVVWAAFRGFRDEQRLVRAGARMVVGCLVWPWLFLVLIRTYAAEVLRDSQARMGEIMAPARVTTTCVDMETRAELINEGFKAAVARGLVDDPARAEDWLADKLAAARAEARTELLDELIQDARTQWETAEVKFDNDVHAVAHVVENMGPVWRVRADWLEKWKADHE
ncbi:MAG: hypothetical protein J7474_04555 [Arthrobacter sp.]|nr:hypothetical protein [Arthrobacter sp.]